MKLDSVGKLWGDAWQRYLDNLDGAMQILLLPVSLVFLGKLFSLSGYEVLRFVGALLSVAGMVYLIAGMIAVIVAMREHAGFDAAYRRAAELFWGYLWVFILLVAVIMGGFIMLVIPGIILTVQLIFGAYAYVVDGRRGMDALLASREYVRGNWWAVFGRMAALLVGTMIPYFILIAIFTFLGGGVGAAFAAALFSLFGAPFMVSYYLTLFENLKTIKGDQPATLEKGRVFLTVSGVLGVAVPLAFILLLALFAWLAYTNGIPAVNGYGML